MENEKIGKAFERRINLDEISRGVARSTIGFAKLVEEQNSVDVMSAGSGTLVQVGSIKGILTAAHVLNTVIDWKNVGIIQRQDTTLGYQNQKINLGHSDYLKITAKNNSKDGPDIGFLRLPPDNVVSLEATNGVFYNLSKRKDQVLSGNQPSSTCLNFMSGIIDEWTKDAPPDGRKVRLKTFSGLFCDTKIIEIRKFDGFDLIDFELRDHPDIKQPKSFGGASGGGLWRGYVTQVEDKQANFIDRWLYGVIFYETPDNRNGMVVTAHGPKSIYEILLKAVSEKWPEEFK